MGAFVRTDGLGNRALAQGPSGPLNMTLFFHGLATSQTSDSTIWYAMI